MVATVDSGNDKDAGTLPQPHSTLSSQGSHHGSHFPPTFMSLPVLPGEALTVFVPEHLFKVVCRVNRQIVSSTGAKKRVVYSFGARDRISLHS